MTKNNNVEYGGKKQIVSTILLFNLAIFYCLSNWSVQAAEQQEPVRAAIIWHAYSDQSYQIMVSERDNEVWSTPQIVAESEKPVTTPSLTILEDDTLLAVWSQQSLGGVRLVSASKGKDEKQWSQDQIVYSDGAWNMNPNLVKDGNGELWLFWSSSVDGDTDIYGMKRSKDKTWSGSQRMHVNNDVPDNKPQARLNENGNIQLQWFHLNQQARRYETNELELEVANSKNLILGTRKLNKEVTELALPKFLPENTSGVLLFKDNVFYQSSRID